MWVYMSKALTWFEHPPCKKTHVTNHMCTIQKIWRTGTICRLTRYIPPGKGRKMVNPSDGRDISLLCLGSGSNITHCIKCNRFSAGKSNGSHIGKGETYLELLCDTRGGSNHIQSKWYDISTSQWCCIFEQILCMKPSMGTFLFVKECTFPPWQWGYFKYCPHN